MFWHLWPFIGAKCIFSTWGNSRVQLFLSTRWCISPYHEWPKAMSDREMHQRVLRKSWTRELPHVEKAFSNVAINKLVNFAISSFPCKTGKFVKSQCWKWLYKPSIGCGSFNSYPTLSDHSKSCLWILMPFLKNFANRTSRTKVMKNSWNHTVEKPFPPAWCINGPIREY